MILAETSNLLTENYKFNNEEEAISAFNTKQLGVKIAPALLNKNAALIKNTFARYYKNAKEYSITEPSYGLQFIVAHSNNVQDLTKQINNETLYTYLKNYKKPWIKQLPSFNDFNSKPFNLEVWHKFYQEINSELNNHGKATKGSGDIKNVKILYPKDSDGWELMIPLNFDGAKAASFFGKENEKPIPTHWCTRADIKFYNQYTDYNEHPLYIIRNYKTGKAYQMSFREDSLNSSLIRIDFLDQDDKDGDEITSGDFSKIPDKLLSLMRIPFSAWKGKTILEYKKVKIPEKQKNENYLDKIKWQKGELNEKAKNRMAIEIGRYGEENAVSKEVAIGGAYKPKDLNSESPIQKYFNTGKKENPNVAPKAGMYKYSLTNSPSQYIIVVMQKGKGFNISKYHTDETSTRNYLSDIAKMDLKQRESDSKNFKNELEFNNRKEELKKVVEKDCAEIMKQNGIKDVNLYNHLIEKLPKDKKFESVLRQGMPSKEFRVESSKYGIVNLNVDYKKRTYQKESVRAISDDTGEKINDPNFLYACWQIAQSIFRNWRKINQDNIIQNRVEKNYKNNMYEEVISSILEDLN